MQYPPGTEIGIENPETLYSIYRDYIKHEDDLLNRRLMSNIILEGFLFAADGFSHELLHAAAFHDGLLADLKVLPMVLPFLGIAAGILAVMSIVAAQSAIEGLKKDWEDIASDMDPKVLSRLPALTGAGQKLSNGLGKVPQIGMVIVIMCGWAAIWWISAAARTLIHAL